MTNETKLGVNVCLIHNRLQFPSELYSKIYLTTRSTSSLIGFPTFI